VRLLRLAMINESLPVLGHEGRKKMMMMRSRRR